MTVDLFIIILSVVIGILFVFVFPPFIKWLAKKVDLVGLFASSEQFMALVQMIINASMISQPTKDIVNSIFSLAKKAVEYAEQLYLNGNLSAEDRKKAAIEYVELALKEMNIEVTEERKKLIMAAIESSVYELPSTNQKLLEKGV